MPGGGCWSGYRYNQCRVAPVLRPLLGSLVHICTPDTSYSLVCLALTIILNVSALDSGAVIRRLHAVSFLDFVCSYGAVRLKVSIILRLSCLTVSTTRNLWRPHLTILDCDMVVSNVDLFTLKSSCS